MSVSTVVARDGARPPLRLRLLARAAVGIARIVERRPPKSIKALLTRASAGAAPATYAQASAARQAVLAVSVRCTGEGCLQRSIATALLCRFRGVWPTWRTGVRVDPFAAHAWVEAEGVPVDEPHPADTYRPLLTVAPHGPDLAAARPGR